MNYILLSIMNPSLLDDEIQNGLLSIGLSKTINEYQELDQRYQWNLISWKYCQKLDKLNLFPINSWYFLPKKTQRRTWWNHWMWAGHLGFLEIGKQYWHQKTNGRYRNHKRDTTSATSHGKIMENFGKLSPLRILAAFVLIVPEYQ